ncbi:Rvt_3 domain-containing protein, partial [Thalictrum thalictroides]
MADFPIEDIPITDQLREEEQSCDPCDLLSRPEGLPIEDTPSTSMGNDVWIIHTDGSCSKTGSGIGCVIIPPNMGKIEKSVRLGFHASNNEAEYEAVLYALKSASNLGAKCIQLFTDSKLIASQFGGTYEARDERMAAYLELIHLAARAFDKISISQRPRNDIRHADALAYLSSAIKMDSSRTIIVDYQKDPNINVPVRRLADMYLSACVFYFLDFKTSPPNPSVVYNMMTRKRKRDISSVAPDNVVDHDLLHISAPAPEVDPSDDSDHEGDDSPE